MVEAIGDVGGWVLVTVVGLPGVVTTKVWGVAVGMLLAALGWKMGLVVGTALAWEGCYSVQD